MIFFTATVILGALSGIDALITVNALFFPFCLFFLAVMFVTLFPSYKINNIFPLFGTGTYNIFVKGLKELSGFSDLLILNLLLPYCEDIRTAKAGGAKSILIAGAVLTAICLSYGLTYPYPYSSEFLLIPYQLSRMVRAGEYFQRFEALFEFVWSLTQLLYTAICVCILSRAFADGFKLKYSKPIIPCIAVFITLLAFEPTSVVDILDTAYTAKEILAPAAFILPIIMPLLYVSARRRRNEEKNR